MHMRMLFTLFVAANLAGALSASPPAPPPPAEYDVSIRYRIDAARTERIIQFREMTRYLESIGFQKDLSENENEVEDRTVIEMTGRIASANVRKILNERHVRTIMLFARGAKTPTEANQLVRVDLELLSGLKPELQHKLYAQTRSVLGDLGFQEAVGFDNRGDSRLVGNIAAKNLLTLLHDLRNTPAGAKETNPFQGVLSPLRIVEVLPQMDLAKPLPRQAEVPANQAKIAPDLRALSADKDEAAKPRRVEIILWTTPQATDRTWQEMLRQVAPELQVEGRLGPLVTVQVRPDHIPTLADLPIVSALRFPRAARLQLEPAGDGKDPLKPLGLDRLHQLGYRGRGTQLAVIDGDFGGYQEMVKAGRLPSKTRLVDLTAERSRELTPDPFPTSTGLESVRKGVRPPILKGSDPFSDRLIGHGTRCALAAAQAAPEAELVLIRVDPAAPHLLQEAARYINGEIFGAPSLDQRASELAGEDASLNDRGEKLLEERRMLLSSGLPFEEFQLKWAEYKARQDAFSREERAHDQRARRYLDLRHGLRWLKGVQIVASSLVWNEGHPVDGSGALSRYFDDQPFRAALWFQAAGDTSGQAWAGLFRDTDGNGAMEFTAAGAGLPSGRWTSELNFLGWRDGKPAQDLPAGAKVRITLQWREAHDPDSLLHGEDAYQSPLADLRLLVLRQRDPSGTKLPADDMELVAQSERQPQRLDNQPSAATYEHAVEFTVPAAGRYAIMVLGRPPLSTRPGNQILFPGAQGVGELRPRVFVDTLSGKGKAALEDFTNDGGLDRGEEGSLGTPGEAHAVVTVGSTNGEGRPAAYSPPGPALNLRLLAKPDILVYDRLSLPDGGSERGTSLAASFAAGMAASASSAGMPLAKFLETMRATPGGVLRIPTNWPSRR